MSDLEARVERLEARVIEAQAFATIALAVAEKSIAFTAAAQPDPDAFLANMHSELRERIAPAAKRSGPVMAEHMFGTLEAVLLHAALPFRRKN